MWESQWLSTASLGCAKFEFTTILDITCSILVLDNFGYNTFDFSFGQFWI